MQMFEQQGFHGLARSRAGLAQQPAGGAKLVEAHLATGQRTIGCADDRQRILQPGLNRQIVAVTSAFDEAETHYRSALRANPGFAEAHFNLGNLRSERGKQAEAVESYRSAVRCAPGLMGARLNLAFALGELGRFPEAIAQCREALRIDPGHAKMHYCLGTLLARTGDSAGAREAWNTALRLQPDLQPARQALETLKE